MNMKTNFSKKQFLARYAGKLSLVLLAVLSFSLTSCSGDEPEAQKYTVNLTVNYPEGYLDGTVATGVTVKATNGSTTSSAVTDENGQVSFSLVSGVYDFSAVLETEEFAFNGSLTSTTIAADQDLTITLKATTLSGGLVIKEYYYAGSQTPEDKTYFSDQFIEIYNNSDEVIYIDQLCIGLIDPLASSQISTWVDESGNLQDKLPLGTTSWYIPGTGQEHPLQPRTSIVIAMDGIDHQTDEAGNPNSPVNLGNADWETYFGDVNGGKDADAANVPNLSLLYTTSTTVVDFLYSVFGSAVVIFKLPTAPAVFAADAANFATKPGATGTAASTLYLQIPREYVVDAVEAVYPDEAKRNKRLPSDLDAGSVFCEKSYNSKSVRRKVKQIVDGKVIYKDTNNSTEDFLPDQTPAPGVHPSAVD